MTDVLSRLEPIRIGPSGIPKLTLGWEAIAWSTEYLRQPDGPDAGNPWNWTDEQARFVLWWYAIDERGRFLYRRGMLRRLKGWGKDPVGAALCGIELAGPCRFAGFDAAGDPVAAPHSAPWVITAAVSLDQTKNTMRLFPTMFSDDAIQQYRIDLGKEIIYTHNGLLEAVTSSPRAMEGKRTSFSLKNEPHHWLENNDGLAMAAVIGRNLAKARGGDARALSISNAHNPGEGSDAEADYDAYLTSLTSELPSDFLYDSLEAPADVDITDPEQVKQALLAARGDSVWLDPERLTAEILDPRTGEGMARRFYLNQVIAGDDVWLARSMWDKQAVNNLVPRGTAICVGFDGSDTDDWTALRCETVDGFQFTPRFADGKLMIWNPAKHGGYTPRGEVKAAIAYLFDTFKVERLYADPYLFQSEIDEWSAEYGEKTVLRWATNRPRAMAECLERFRTDVLSGVLKHDGCPITSKHIENAHADRKPAGVLIRKDKHISKNKIDAVMSSALAHEAAYDAKAEGWGGHKRRKLTRVKGRVSGY
jgi:phage terminase large subunit-like protein